jgi:hypothetical protein
MKKILTTFFVLLVLTGAGSLPVSADIPGAHPGYLRALSDLRWARAYASRDNPGPRDHFVIDEIDRAINEIKIASIDDGKNLNDHPPIDANLDFRGRFRRALDLLNHAHRAVAKEEDNVYAQGLQQRALDHIDKAHHALKEIIDNW